MRLEPKTPRLSRHVAAMSGSPYTALYFVDHSVLQYLELRFLFLRLQPIDQSLLLLLDPQQLVEVLPVLWFQH